MTMSMDFLETFNALDEIFSGVNWRIEKFTIHPLFDGFDEHVTGNALLPIEYIKQSGDADYGYYGEAYVPINYGDGAYLYITYCD